MGVPSSNRTGIAPRRAQGRAKGNTARKGMRPDFLNFKFGNLSGYDLCTVTARCEDIDLTSLEGQVKEYLNILGGDAEIERSGNSYKDAAKLIEKVKAKTDNEWVEFANVEEDDGSRTTCSSFP